MAKDTVLCAVWKRFPLKMRTVLFVLVFVKLLLHYTLPHAGK